MASETFINELGDEVTLSVRPQMGYALIELRSGEPQSMSLTPMEARKLRELIAREDKGAPPPQQQGGTAA